MNKKYLKLQAKFIKSIVGIVNLFAEKQGYNKIHLHDFHFISADVVQLADDFYSLDDIMYDLAYDVEKGKAVTYNELVLERSEKELDSVSYHLYVERGEIDPAKSKSKFKVDRRHSDKERLEQLQKELNELAGGEVDLSLFINKKK